MKFSIKDFFSKCDQIRRKLRIWSHLLKKSSMENFIFCAVSSSYIDINFSLLEHVYSEVYSEPRQISEMEHLIKIVNDFLHPCKSNEHFLSNI